MTLNNHEPPPKKSDKPAVWDLVMEDIKQRDSAGAQKYGVRLQPCNGRNSAIDLYQELLDGVVYCRQMIEERKMMIELLQTCHWDLYYCGRSDELVNDLRTFLESIGEME